jgi:hypothetical protein
MYVYIYIVQHGADVNAADVTAQTALHWTGVRGSIQVAELLLQQGASLECADTHGYRVHVLKLCWMKFYIRFVDRCGNLFVAIFYFLFFPTIPRVIEEAAFVLALG